MTVYSSFLLESNFSWINLGYFISSLAVTLLGIISIKISKYIELNSSKKEYLNDLERLKKNADIIEVKLENCEILNNNYIVEKPSSNNYRIQTINKVFGSKNKTIRTKTSKNRVSYKTIYDGKNKLFYSQIITMDKDVFKIKLVMQEKTYLYIDKTNKNNYYFDLTFLN